MGAGAIRAGRAFVELFADDTKLQGTLKRTSASLQKWGAGIGAIGAGIVTAFLPAIKAASDMEETMNKFNVHCVSCLHRTSTSS